MHQRQPGKETGYIQSYLTFSLSNEGRDTPLDLLQSATSTFRMFCRGIWTVVKRQDNSEKERKKWQKVQQTKPILLPCNPMIRTIILCENIHNLYLFYATPILCNPLTAFTVWSITDVHGHQKSSEISPYLACYMLQLFFNWKDSIILQLSIIYFRTALVFYSFIVTLTTLKCFLHLFKVNKIRCHKFYKS